MDVSSFTLEMNFCLADLNPIRMDLEVNIERHEVERHRCPACTEARSNIFLSATLLEAMRTEHYIVARSVVA